MATTYIGIVGEKGSGKAVFTSIVQKLLPNKRVASFRFSQPVREILGILDKEISRKNFTTLMTALRKGFNDEGILYPAVKKLLRSVEADIITIDGIRKPEEVKIVREVNGILLYITANQRLRFERRSRDPENSDEPGMTFEAFAEQELAPTEIDISKIGKTADAKIENNGSEEELEDKIKQFLADYRLL